MENETVQSNEQNNVDQLLDSVSDAYLAKKKRTRIISFSIISFIVFALVVSIIVLSCIKVDLRPKFIDKGASYEIHISGQNNLNINPTITREEYDKFNELFLNSFKTQYLSALFTGKLGGYEVKESTKEFFYSNTSAATGMTTELQSYVGDNYVKITYDQPIEIKNSKGKTCYTEFDTTKPLMFEDVYFPLNTVDAERDLVFYLGGFGYVSKGNARIVKVSVRANMYDIYNYFKD